MSQQGAKFPNAVPEGRNSGGLFRRLLIMALRVALLLAVGGATWLVYRELPVGPSDFADNRNRTNLQIVLRQPEDPGPALDVEVRLFPVDIVAARHEFFSEPRAGKRLEDFIKERMKGRSPVSTRLDKQGHGSLTLPPGSWWLHAILSGDEQIEWRLPVTVAGSKQVIELTSQNAYTRSRTF